MKYILKYSTVLLLLAGMTLLTDCKKDKFLNVNNNPNYPASVPISQLLPTCESNIAYMVGNTLAIYGGLWAQYWTQDPTYGVEYQNFDSYVNIPTDNDNVWLSLYTNATSLNYIIANADSAHKNYAAIAYFMKAYTFQLLTDGWGDVPASQALQGTANVSPKYDPGQQIYDSVAVWINTGMRLVNLNQPCPPEDLIYTSMQAWQKFGNTLLLKVYLRECLKNPTAAQAGIQALATQMAANGTSFMTAPPASPGIDLGGDDAAVHYLAITNHQSPLYAAQIFLQAPNLNASATVMNYLLATNDPRVKDFFGIDQNGGYGGELQGDWIALAGAPSPNFSPISTEILSGTAPNRLLTTSESYFLQAEAVVRGYLHTGSASTLYASGVAASFASWDSSAALGAGGVANYLAGDSVNFALANGQSGQLKLILTQKWVSMCGNQTFEAWTEWRRTRIPGFFTQSISSRIPAGDWPRRLVYPSAELDDNTNFPGYQYIYVPVWWDINP